MTDKARELLERALEQADYIYFVTCEADTLAEEIRAYLSEPEVKRERMSYEQIVIEANETSSPRSFYLGVRFAEKHHGITGGGE